MAVGQGGSGRGIALLVGAEIVYAIVAAACSSPQTAEINAKSRADTLMKWVHIGLVQSAIFVGLAVAYDKQHAQPILVGGGVAAVLMYGSYMHAKQAGLASVKPGTESSMGAWNNPT
jgi:hypothetical protein